MRTRLIALAATLGILGLAAASLAGATPPSGGGGGGGGASAGGGGGSHGGGGGGGGSHGGGGGGHFGGGGYRGGGYAGGGYRGGGFVAHSGYVAHGSSGYRYVGYESASTVHLAGVAGAGAGHTPRINVAFGPRMGSAATAARLERVSRADHMRPRPGHPYGHHHPKHLFAAPRYRYEPYARANLFCGFPSLNYQLVEKGLAPDFGCLWPTKAKPTAATTLHTTLDP